MFDVTHILSKIEAGDQQAANELLPLVYEELHKLAAARMGQESPDHTLQSTALVHEAYVRLVDTDKARRWDSRGHFFSAAAESMRRILIDHARKKSAQKRGGEAAVVQYEIMAADAPFSAADMLDFDEALSHLEETDPQAARIVSLRVFAGLTVEEAAESIGVPARTAFRDWSFAKAWLFQKLHPAGI
jgi:RNA polymerase sigma factor (TIGR02999 family)